MRQRPYHLRLREHLVRYKRDVLGVVEDGTWSYKGSQLPYAHILPVRQRRLNVVDSAREEFWSYWDRQSRSERRPAKLHRNFSHLTSSQALAFNVFFPFLGSARADGAALLSALGLIPEPIREWRFEAVLDPDEGTNFDVVVVFHSGRRLLVEVKLTEGEFGVCRDDARHREKLETLYAARLAGKVNEDALQAPAFFNRYQILRNISYADANTQVLFLYPRDNAALAEGAAFVQQVVRPSYRDRVRTVHLEELLTRLADTCAGTALARDVAALRSKYLIPSDGADHSG